MNAEKRVGDLKVGDAVLNWGTVTEAVVGYESTSSSRPEINVEFKDGTRRFWPAEATITVRQGPEIEVAAGYWGGWRVLFGHPQGESALFTCKRHAESYAERLRNEPELLTEAMGEA